MFHDLKKMPGVEQALLWLPRKKDKSPKNSQEWGSMEAWKGAFYCFVCIMVCLGSMKKGIISV